MIQSLCVDWRKALRCVWSVNNRTHCDIITSLSNQSPLILSLTKRFIKFIRNCLVCQNYIVKIISQFITQCLTQVAIIEVHWTVMASYLLNPIRMTGN